MPTLNFQLRKLMAILKGPRLSVLLALILHSNSRLRCWPSTRILKKETGYATESIVEARQWLQDHGAFRLLPHEERSEEEKNLSIRQFIYELSGQIEIDGAVYDYLYLNPDYLKFQSVELQLSGTSTEQNQSISFKDQVVTPKDKVKDLQLHPQSQPAPLPDDPDFAVGQKSVVSKAPSTPVAPFSQTAPADEPTQPSKKPSKDAAWKQAIAQTFLGWQQDPAVLPYTAPQSKKIGMIQSAIKTAYLVLGVDYVTLDASDEIRAFVAWYKANHKNAQGQALNLPGVGKLDLYWQPFVTSRKAVLTQPAAPLSTETEAERKARRDLFSNGMM